VASVRAFSVNAPRRKRRAMPKLKNPEPPAAKFQFSFRRMRPKKHRIINDNSNISQVDFVTSTFDSCATFSNSENSFRLTISTQLIPKAKRQQTTSHRFWAPVSRDGADDPLPEDDPRACPRDMEDFKLAVAFELDRLREKKAILDE